MSQLPATREAFLERLEDLLPPKEMTRVRREIEALLLDHAAGERERDPSLDEETAQARALAALGNPEDLAEDLVPTKLRIPLTTQRNFVRLLAAVFACHLLLSIALTVAGARSPAVPSLLQPLPLEPFGSVFLGVLTIFLIDAGALLMLFGAIGQLRPERPHPLLLGGSPWTRRGAIEGLVFLALLALLSNVYLERVFSVTQGETIQTFLALELREIVPYLNIVFGLFAVRHVLTLTGRGGSAWSLAADALGSLAGSAWLILAATRAELVHMPIGNKLEREAAEVLDNLIERVFLLVLVVGALLFIVQFVRQAMRCANRVRA